VLQWSRCSNGVMQVHEVYLEVFGRIEPLVRVAVDGLDPGQLVAQPQPGTNPVGWLVWHLTRVQDHHVGEVMGEEQIWPAWEVRFGLAPDPTNIGFGHTPADVGAVQPESPQVLVDYYGAVFARTRGLLESLTPQSLDRVVDVNWDPPVTLGVRLVSVADDSLQHVCAGPG
jgi:hypothetical protein